MLLRLNKRKISQWIFRKHVDSGIYEGIAWMCTGVVENNGRLFYSYSAMKDGQVIYLELPATNLFDTPSSILKEMLDNPLKHLE